MVGDVFILRDEGACAHAGGVGLADADDAVNFVRRNTRAGAGASGRGVGGGDERIGAEVHIQVSSLGPFKEDAFSGGHGFVHNRNGVGDVGAQHIRGGAYFRHHFFFIHSGKAHAFHFRIRHLDAAAQHFVKNRGIPHIRHAHADAACLVRVSGADAALGGADGFFAEGGFLGGVHFLVEGKDHVGAVGDEKVVFCNGHALAAEFIDFLHQADGVQHHTITDDAKLVRPQDAGGNQVENIFLSIGNYSMAGVVAALAACHHVGGFRQEIDHFALAFVAPLGADNNGIHDKNGTRRP